MMAKEHDAGIKRVLWEFNWVEASKADATKSDVEVELDGLPTA